MTGMWANTTYLIFSVHGVAATNASGRALTGHVTVRTVIAPVRAAGSIRTISGHVPGIATNTTDDIGGEISLLWAVEFSMPYLSAVLTSLVLIVTKGTVQGCQFAKLIALKFVLAFRDRGGLHEKAIRRVVSFCGRLTVSITL